ncbi:nijmegen breakage syndrome 1 isoform X2 [Wolffia australiana]
MVWGLFPLDTQQGSQSYYIFSGGAYKIGRKDCDIIIQTDRAISRIHAEIIIDGMHPENSNRGSTESRYARIKDLSKFGTFINKESGSKPVNTLPMKESFLRNGDLVSFGTGNATFRFCFISFVVYADSILLDANPSLQEAISSTGSVISRQFSSHCTYMIVGESTAVTEDLIAAAIAQKPVLLGSWFLGLAAKKVRTEIPGFADHIPTLMFDGMSVRVVEPASRQNCLLGYDFILTPPGMYKFRDQLAKLLELVGGKIHHVDTFSSSRQAENQQTVFVIPEGSRRPFGDINEVSPHYRIRETKLIAAVLSGNLDPSFLEQQTFSLPSSESTDETIIPESDLENDTATTSRLSGPLKVDKETEHEESMTHAKDLDTSTKAHFRSSKVGLSRSDVPEIENYGKSEVIYSQSLIVRDTTPDVTFCSSKQKAVNFKQFRKREVVSGNTYKNLIPYSNEPYQELDYGNEDLKRYVKEEKILKQREALAEDLFNTEKARKRGAASFRSSFAR